MRNLINLIFIALALIGWGVVIYQNKLQKESESRIAGIILEQLEYSQQIKDTIRSEVAKREKEQELVLQIENQRELIESLRQEIKDSEEKVIARSLGLEESFTEKISDYQAQQEALLDQFKEDLTKQLAENSSKIFYLNKKIEEEIKQNTIIQERLDQIQRELEECKNKQEEYQRRIAHLENKLAEKQEEKNLPLTQEVKE